MRAYPQLALERNHTLHQGRARRGSGPRAGSATWRRCRWCWATVPTRA